MFKVNTTVSVPLDFFDASYSTKLPYIMQPSCSELYQLSSTKRKEAECRGEISDVFKFLLPSVNIKKCMALTEKQFIFPWSVYDANNVTYFTPDKVEVLWDIDQSTAITYTSKLAVRVHLVHIILLNL